MPKKLSNLDNLLHTLKNDWFIYFALISNGFSFFVCVFVFSLLSKYNS